MIAAGVVVKVPWTIDRLARFVLVQGSGQNDRVPLDRGVIVNELPSESACDLEFLGRRYLRLIKSEDSNRLIIWNPEDQRKTFSPLLANIQASDVRVIIVEALEYFDHLN